MINSLFTSSNSPSLFQDEKKHEAFPRYDLNPPKPLLWLLDSRIMIWDISSKHDLGVELDWRTLKYEPDDHRVSEGDVTGNLVNWPEKRFRQKDLVQPVFSLLRAGIEVCFEMILRPSHPEKSSWSHSKHEPTWPVSIYTTETAQTETQRCIQIFTNEVRWVVANDPVKSW